MGRIKVSRQQPPILGTHKDIPFQNEQQFVLALTEWIGSFVSRHRAMHLVVQAVGFQEVLNYIQHAPAAMTLSAGPRKWRVYVEFFWGRTADRQWWVSGLGFHIKDTVNNIAAANKAMERERLHDLNDTKHAMAAIPARKAYFEVETFSNDFDHDLHNGREITKILIEKAYEVAKELAKMATNPIGPDPDNPWSILGATVGAVLGVGAGEALGALERQGSTVARVATGAHVGEEMKNALMALGYAPREVFEVAKTAVEMGDRVRGRIADNSAVAALADLVEIGMGLSKVAGPFAPLASAIIGSFIDIAIANQAGPVTRVRSHMYVCYVGGVIKELTNETSVKLTRPGDSVFFEYGQKRARKIGREQRYNLQLALLEYALRHPVGEWNLNPMYREKPPFPDAYIRYWSPGMLERALLVQLCKPDYLYR
jgi:hypothetical protein